MRTGFQKARETAHVCDDQEKWKSRSTNPSQIGSEGLSCEDEAGSESRRY
jgi:hypothetical protein